MAEEKDVVEEKINVTPKKEKRSIFSRIWNGLFRLHGDNFEKRLQYISREEAILLVRMKKRSRRCRRMARNLIVLSVLLEVVALGYGIITTRSMNLDWIMRGLRVLPIFLLPALSWVLYSALLSFTGMCDRRDQRTLERLRAERQEKIDELKERTNYYNTQQLIQRYDTDPAAKAAAASVLASRLGADSGLQVFVGDEPHLNQHGIGKSSDTELVQSSGLRRRNPSEARSPGSTVADHSDKEATSYAGSEVSEISLPSELVAENPNPVAINAQEGGWIARLAAMLVGEDPTQSYALICGNCHMHNGLARKEDFPVITYYCPHCHSLNKPRSLEENYSGTNTPDMRSSTTPSRALNKPRNSDENSSGTNSPDMRYSVTHQNKPRKSEQSSSGPDVRNPLTRRHALNKPRNTDENFSDANTPDKSRTAVANANLIEQSSESMSGNVSASSNPEAVAVEETKTIVAEDLADH